MKERVAKVKSSGQDARNLKVHVAGVTEQWRAVAQRAGSPVDFTEWDCYAAGCTVTSRHRSPSSIARLLTEFAHTNAFHRWSAGKFRSAPLQATDGAYEVTWIFLAPPAGQPVMRPENELENSGEKDIREKRR